MSNRKTRIASGALAIIALLLVASCDILGAGSGDQVPLSSEARLASLELSGYGIGFDPSETMYELNVPSGTTMVSLSATPEYAGSTVEYSDDGGTAYDTYTGAVTINVGPDGTTTTIAVRVTSEFSATQKIYFIDVTVAEAGASTVATLNSLELYDWEGIQVVFDPVFSSGTFEYEANVGSTVDEISYINYEPTDFAASVSDPTPFDLVVGPNVMDIVVTAPDGITLETYSVTITRAFPPSVAITSPAEGATIDTTTFQALGTYSDPNGEIDSLIITFDGMTPVGTAVLDGAGGFTANVDASGVTNGTKTLMAIASDGPDMVAMDTVTITYTAGITGYSVTVTVDYDGMAACEGYLSVTLIKADYSGVGGIVTGIVVDSASFPYTTTVEGIPPGDYIISARVTTDADPSSTPIYENDLFSGPVGVSVVDADVTVATTTVMLEAE